MAAVLENRSRLRDVLSVVTASLRLAAGVVAYSISRRTPDFAYQSLIRLFTLTSGRSNDLLANAIGLLRRRYPIDGFDGVLGFRTRADLDQAAAQLAERGFCVFDRQLPADLCERLYQFALTRNCRPRATDSQAVAPEITPSAYPRSSPQSIIYDFSPDDLINSAPVQELMADRSINALAEAYLDAKPVLDTVNMWWTTAYSSRPDANAAQLYHFDMDHIRWLKFFVYLTDMTPEAGPHCFVAGTHRSGRIPRKFLAQGYPRLSDADVAASFPASDLMEFMGKRGTIIVEDTRGLHKGKPALRGDRLMLELEFSNSLFGAVLPARGELTAAHTPEFARFVGNHRRIFSRWIGARTPL
jgi:hypothetical protein